MEKRIREKLKSYEETLKKIIEKSIELETTTGKIIDDYACHYFFGYVVALVKSTLEDKV